MSRYDVVGPLVSDPLPRRRPSPQLVLQGQYCRLERMSASIHSGSLWQAFQSADSVWDFMSSGPFRSAEDFAQHLEKLSQPLDPMMFVVVDLRSYKCVGFLSLMRIDPAAASIEAGFLTYSPGMQRTVLSTEAIFLFMAHAFNDLKYRRFEWKCNANNVPSVEAAMRFGFSYEGTFRAARIDRGRSRNTAWFSIIESEWPDREAAFKAYLRRSNFLPKQDTDVPSFTALRQVKPLSDFLVPDPRRAEAGVLPLCRRAKL